MNALSLFSPLLHLTWCGAHTVNNTDFTVGLDQGNAWLFVGIFISGFNTKAIYLLLLSRSDNDCYHKPAWSLSDWLGAIVYLGSLTIMVGTVILTIPFSIEIQMHTAGPTCVACFIAHDVVCKCERPVHDCHTQIQPCSEFDCTQT